MTYFLTTVKEGGKIRLRPLPHQRLSDGTVINSNWNVQGSSSIRDENPVGTIFSTDSLTVKSHAATLFYSAGAICVADRFSKDFQDYRTRIAFIGDVLRKSKAGIICLRNSQGETMLLTDKDTNGERHDYVRGFLPLFNLKDKMWTMIPDSEQGIGSMSLVNYGKVG